MLIANKLGVPVPEIDSVPAYWRFRALAAMEAEGLAAEDEATTRRLGG
jgi:hypothetical protein